jgi:LmbE family N-acetylglucosaminyl deacetylase
LTLIAVAFPILPDKTAEWHSFVGELNGSRHAEFAAARERAGVHERTFLQHTPMGDLAIVTLEGDDPGRSFGQMMSSTDAFTVWFCERVKTIHGVDLTAPMTGAPSELVVDSLRAPVLAR